LQHEKYDNYLDKRRSHPGQYLPLRQVTVSDHRQATPVISPFGVSGQYFGQLRLNRLLNQPLGTGAQ
jgi:hypothetical protein